MSFVEAVQDLAQQYGMQVPQDDQSPQDRARAQEQREKQHTLTSVLEQAGDAYRKALRESDRAIAYFKGRGLSGEVAKQFDLGYAPEGWRSLASVFPDYADPLLVESGLVIVGEDDEDKRYDRFRDRVMFPIRNVKGECIGFGGRVLGDEKPKYLNSPETPVFSKGRELYGLFEARNALREHGFVLVTEGYMDVVALAQLGFPNAVATLGTACTNEHVQKLFRFTDSVVFSFDGDAAGRRAARKALDGALPFATDTRSVKFLFLPAEHDPDSFIREHGQEAFSQYIAQALPLSRFLIEASKEDCDLSSAEGRSRFASNAKPLWMALPDGALKRQLLGEIADVVQLGTHELNELWLGRPAAAPRRSSGEERPRKPAAEFERKASSFSSPAAKRGRTAPTGRADQAVRLLLTYRSAWETLSNEDHVMLCELPPPHGPLLSWLEAQLHEHGPQPWGALREGLQGHESEGLALRLMSDLEVEPVEADESVRELRALLNRMLVERLKAQETLAIEAAASDPLALERYRALQARRREIELKQ